MRRMELKKPTTAAKEPEKKKTLRLEERQKKIIEKKKGHKMLKQISDESSDGESDNESEKKKVRKVVPTKSSTQENFDLTSWPKKPPKYNMGLLGVKKSEKINIRTAPNHIEFCFLFVF